MNFFQLKCAVATLLSLGLMLASVAHAAPPPKVNSANPNSALQGEALDVVIGGSNFQNGAAVKFLVTETSDDSQIDVNGVTYNADGTLTASVQVQGEALISDYDIEVTNPNGRRGKGTTLFAVYSSSGGGNSEPLSTISCDDLFGFDENTCTAAGTGTDPVTNPFQPCMFVKEFIEARSYEMTQDCDTRAMLVVHPDHPFLWGGGYRLNLVAPWSGDYAGITNSMGANKINNFRVVASDTNVAAGCIDPNNPPPLPWPVQVAIHFDPDRAPRSSSPRGGVGNSVVETENGAQFCKGIEFVGSDPIITTPYKEVGVSSNHIMANSYELAAIEMAYVNQSDVNDETKKEFAKVQNNIVEASDAPCAAGIVMGPGVERPALINNLVYVSSGAGCAERTVGIAVLGSGRTISPHPWGSAYDLLKARTSDINGNTIHTGGDGSIGILIDGATDAETTKSQITAGEGSDFGVCVETGANFDETGRRSDYIGFAAGNEVVLTNDCGAVVP